MATLLETKFCNERITSSPKQIFVGKNIPLKE